MFIIFIVYLRNSFLYTSCTHVVVVCDTSPALISSCSSTREHTGGILRMSKMFTSRVIVRGREYQAYTPYVREINFYIREFFSSFRTECQIDFKISRWISRLFLFSFVGWKWIRPWVDLIFISSLSSFDETYSCPWHTTDFSSRKAKSFRELIPLRFMLLFWLHLWK